MANNTSRYTFSISHSDHDIISFLEAKRNTSSLSSYIRNLIRRDMGQAVLDEEQFEDIYQYLLRRLQETGTTVSFEIAKKPIVEDADKDMIMTLF